MNREGMRKDLLETSPCGGIQMNVVFGVRISAWDVCDARLLVPLFRDLDVKGKKHQP